MLDGNYIYIGVIAFLFISMVLLKIVNKSCKSNRTHDGHVGRGEFAVVALAIMFVYVLILIWEKL